MFRGSSRFPPLLLLSNSVGEDNVVVASPAQPTEAGGRSYSRFEGVKRVAISHLFGGQSAVRLGLATREILRFVRYNNVLVVAVASRRGAMADSKKKEGQSGEKKRERETGEQVFALITCAGARRPLVRERDFHEFKCGACASLCISALAPPRDSDEPWLPAHEFLRFTTRQCYRSDTSCTNVARSLSRCAR